MADFLTWSQKTLECFLQCTEIEEVSTEDFKSHEKVF